MSEIIQQSSYLWYEKDRSLYEAEIIAMKKFFPQFKETKTENGILSWQGKINSPIGDGTKWELLLIYDNDHPHIDSVIGSVKVYLVNPKLEDLEEKLEEKIPLLLKDLEGNLHIPTIMESDLQNNDTILTAVAYLGRAIKWIAFYELWLAGDLSTDEFNGFINLENEELNEAIEVSVETSIENSPEENQNDNAHLTEETTDIPSTQDNDRDNKAETDEKGFWSQIFSSISSILPNSSGSDIVIELKGMFYYVARNYYRGKTSYRTLTGTVMKDITIEIMNKAKNKAKQGYTIDQVFVVFKNNKDGVQIKIPFDVFSEKTDVTITRRNNYIWNKENILTLIEHYPNLVRPLDEEVEKLKKKQDEEYDSL